MRRRGLFVAAWVASGGCVSSLPEVPPEAFACTDNRPLEDGSLQCPDTHRCAAEQCRPRFDCREPNSEALGCARDLRRCSLRDDDFSAGVACESGLHAWTSTAPADPTACECPDGLVCAALGDLEAPADPERYALFVFAAARRPAELPVAPLGLSGEHPKSKLCVRPCATEADCSANHTCRAAPVLSAATIGAPADGRATIGACYPNLLLTTATVAEQPDPIACRSEGDCTLAAGRFDGLCQARVIEVPDHPTVPAGAAWGVHRAVVARCVQEGGNLRPDGQGCIEGTDCLSGVCHSQRCATLCDPERPTCSGGRSCQDFAIERKIQSGARVEDRLYLCEPN
ncbi:MAG: hypothetical protein IT384_32675 [Deltaproteobacteria bacterium]|nr:hypothetical protein [Deltaproteobacteria bacterium]